MKNIYTLYVKTHNVTGLKYLGQTKKENVHKYKGSGKIWRDHLIEHGDDVSTQILVQSEDKSTIAFWGRYYSDKWNIVESTQWANLIPETCGGGYINVENNKRMSIERKGVPKSEETKKKMKDFWKDRPPHSLEVRQKISNTLTGRKHNIEQRQRNSLSKLGKKKTKEHANNISKARKGMKFSEEHKQNIKLARCKQSIVGYMLKDSLKYYFSLWSNS